jgi:hypothetical protein
LVLALAPANDENAAPMSTGADKSPCLSALRIARNNSILSDDRQALARHSRSSVFQDWQ